MSEERQKRLPKDATYVGEGLYQGPRGVVLYTLSVFFKAQASIRAWQKLIRELRFSSEEFGSILTASFTALPERLGEGSPYLMGRLMVDPQLPNVADWLFQWVRAPDDHPPPAVLESSKQVGSFPQVLFDLERLWPASSALQMSVGATYVLALQDWEISLPGMAGRELRSGKRALRLEPTRWEFKPRSGILKEVTREVGSNEKFLFLKGEGTLKRAWTPQFLNEADAAIWNGLKALLKRR